MPGPVLDPGKIPGKVFIPNCLALRLIWQMPNGKRTSNILHTLFDNTPVLSQAVVNAVWSSGISSAFLSSGIGTYLHEDTALLGIGVRDMSEVIPPGNVGHAEWLSEGTAQNGTSTENPMPVNVALVVTLRGNQSGQSGRGRVYLGGWAANANDASGQCVSEAATSADAFIFAIDTFLSGSTYGWPLAIAHPARQAYTSDRTGVSYPDRPAGTLDVQTIQHRDLVWDTQRLRNRL